MLWPFNILTMLVCVCLIQAGIYWVTLIDQFAASWVVLFLVLLEIIGFCYIYGEYIHNNKNKWRLLKGNRGAWNPNVGCPCHPGGNRLIKDIEMMLGEKSCTFWLWWRACWFCISPCIILVGTATMTVLSHDSEAGKVVVNSHRTTVLRC